MAPHTPIVVVSGPPASGKTTLATVIAEELGLPLIGKDPIKERLYDALGPGDREWSMRLGRATYPLLFDFLAQELRARRPVVIEGTFGPEYANREFASLHRRWPFSALQLHCKASPEVLLARYAERAPSRHPGHLDASIGEDVATKLRDGSWAPLNLIGDYLEVDTTTFPANWYASALQVAREHVYSSGKPVTSA